MQKNKEFFSIQIDNPDIINEIIFNKQNYLNDFSLLEINTVNFYENLHKFNLFLYSNNFTNILEFCSFISKKYSIGFIGNYENNFFIYNNFGKYIYVDSINKFDNKIINNIFYNFNNIFNTKNEINEMYNFKENKNNFLKNENYFFNFHKKNLYEPNNKFIKNNYDNFEEKNNFKSLQNEANNFYLFNEKKDYLNIKNELINNWEYEDSHQNNNLTNAYSKENNLHDLKEDNLFFKKNKENEFIEINNLYKELDDFLYQLKFEKKKIEHDQDKIRKDMLTTKEKLEIIEEDK